MNNTKFYICETCGNLVETINASGVPMVCCGRKMTELVPGTVDASKEKHIPVVTVDGNNITVNVGSVEHPMTEEHLINWIYLKTCCGGYIKYLGAGNPPVASFTISPEEAPIAVYAYCNLHGLWMAEVVEAPVCDLKPVDTETKENYVVCKCNAVYYFDILDEIHKHSDVDALLDVFEAVKNTTHCSTGCGGCYDKVIHIISETMANGEKH